MTNRGFYHTNLSHQWISPLILIENPWTAGLLHLKQLTKKVHEMV